MIEVMGRATAGVVFIAIAAAASSCALAAVPVGAGFVPTTAILNPGPFGTAPATTDNDALQIAALIRSGHFDRAIALAGEMAKSRPNDPAGYNFLGTAYLGKRDLVNARRSFERALAAHPDDPIALANLAQIDIQQKDVASARKRFQAVLAKDRTNVSAMLGMAQIEFARDDDNAALAWLAKARSAQPDAVDPRMNLAAYHIRRGNSVEAIRELSDARRAIPGNADVLHLLGQAQLAAGMNQPAIATFKELVAVRPEAPLSHYRLATAQIASNDIAGATQSLNRALAQKPDFVEALVALAGVETRAKRYTEALALAQKVKATQPNAPTGLVLEGDILAAQARHADAAAAYERAFALAPSGALVAKMHDAHVKAGNEKSAERALASWLDKHPGDVAVLHYAALDDLRRKDVKRAIATYQRIVARDAKNVLALNNLAGLYHQTNDPRARATAESAYKLAPESPAVLDTLGWILVGQGETARGIRLLEAATAAAPGSPEIRYHLAAARARTGDRSSARRELQALLAAGQPFAEREAAQQLLNQL